MRSTFEAPYGRKLITDLTLTCTYELGTLGCTLPPAAPYFATDLESIAAQVQVAPLPFWLDYKALVENRITAHLRRHSAYDLRLMEMSLRHQFYLQQPRLHDQSKLIDIDGMARAIAMAMYMQMAMLDLPSLTLYRAHARQRR